MIRLKPVENLLSCSYSLTRLFKHVDERKQIEDTRNTSRGSRQLSKF